MITKALVIGIMQLCSVTEQYDDCYEWMLECVNIVSCEQSNYTDDNLLEVCIESYEGDFLDDEA